MRRMTVRFRRHITAGLLVLVPVVYVKVDQWAVTFPVFLRRLMKRPVRSRSTAPVVPVELNQGPLA